MRFKLCPNLKANPHSLTYQSVCVCSSSPFCRWSFCTLCRVTPSFLCFCSFSNNPGEGLWRNSDGDITSGLLVLLLKLQSDFEDSESPPWNLTRFKGKKLAFQKHTYSILHKNSVNEVAVDSEPEVRLNPDWLTLVCGLHHHFAGGGVLWFCCVSGRVFNLGEDIWRMGTIPSSAC